MAKQLVYIRECPEKTRHRDTQELWIDDKLECYLRGKDLKALSTCENLIETLRKYNMPDIVERINKRELNKNGIRLAFQTAYKNYKKNQQK